MIKYLRSICLLILICFVGIVIYGKSKIIKLDYNDYIKESTYTMSDEDYFSFYPNLKGVLIDDSKVTNLEDLINKSDYVLKIKTTETKSFTGEGILNQAHILEVMKGKDLQVGKNIQIYDHIMHFAATGIDYFLGAKPLNHATTYIVFLKKAPNPNVEGTYIFSSVKYGSFRLTENIKTLNNYENDSLSMEKIMKYDYISPNEHIDSVFINIHKEIYQKYGS